MVWGLCRGLQGMGWGHDMGWGPWLLGLGPKVMGAHGRRAPW